MEFNTIEEALEELRAGRLIVVLDDPGRENEGDLVCSARAATPENVNFMASFAKGLICMPMSREMTVRLSLPQMVASNTDNHCTAFTVSIDHVSTTTGISAFERSVTAMATVREGVSPSDFRRPGHMFPLEARPGGVLERPGHTEATVDLMRAAGLEECGLCCEIMNDDGTMMRTAGLMDFAQRHSLKIITIEDLAAYRRRTEFLVRRTAETVLPTRYGSFRAYGYVNSINSAEHVALVMGDTGGDDPVLCRVHSECLTGDVFGSMRCDCGEQLDEAMRRISAAGRGVLLYMKQEGRGIGLVNKLRAYGLQDKGMDTVEANLALGFKADAREYESAADMLWDLGVKKVILMTNNPLKMSGLSAHGLEIAAREPIEPGRNARNEFYMYTKYRKMGHMLHFSDSEMEIINKMNA
jgi:3,4-dihydroxy 2-butanone 4-phosphate synthase / GTP cyclohydrolase II